MKRQMLMGIDVGTQSTRVALLDLEGQVVASTSTPQKMMTPRPGWAEQDPDIWWHNALDNIHKAMEQAEATPDEVLAVGVCGQMHATVPLSRDGELLSHGVQLWCDKRSADLVDEFKAGPHVEAAMRLAGTTPVPNWLGFNIKWLQVHEPDLYEKTWKFVLSKDYINYRLTGDIATDWSEASGSFLMDAKTKTWSPELAGYLELDLDKLPDVRASSDAVGKITAEAADLTGLAEGTLVTVGAGDMLCMLLSSGLTEPGRASDITGTASIMAIYVEEPVLDPRLMNLHHALPGWIPFGISDSGGGALKWFKDELCQAETAEAERSGKDVYDILNPKAAAVEPGSEGLLFFPYLMGERSLGTPFARGVFFGLTPRTGTGAMVRAIMEGVTFELRRTLEIVEDAGNTVREVYTIGGGARSDLWSQIKADIYKKPVYTFEASEGGILGSAILAGVGVGVYADARAGAEQCLRVDKVFQPNPSRAARYDYLYELFKEVHDRMQEPFDKLAHMP
ncbi:MAG: FGGY family carbohydrate kinase [Anaerolineae bacterium]|nr:FGGY family carbohydrate kinase [Anaerolineae bacterium]